MSVLCLRKSEGCGIPWSLIYIQLWTSVRTAFCLSLQFPLLFCFWALLSTTAYPVLNSLNWSGWLKSNSCLCLSFLNIFGDILFARIFLHIFICLLVLCVNMFILCMYFYFVCRYVYGRTCAVVHLWSKDSPWELIPFDCVCLRYRTGVIRLGRNTFAPGCLAGPVC